MQSAPRRANVATRTRAQAQARALLLQADLLAHDVLGATPAPPMSGCIVAKKSQKPSTECQVTGEDRTAAAQPPPPLRRNRTSRRSSVRRVSRIGGGAKPVDPRTEPPRAFRAYMFVIIMKPRITQATVNS